MTYSHTFASFTGDATFISKVAGCCLLSPVDTSEDNFGGSVAVARDSLWMSSTLGTLITVGVFLLLTSSTFKEEDTSFLNNASDLMISSTSMLSTSMLGGDTSGDADTDEDALVGEDSG